MTDDKKSDPPMTDESIESLVSMVQTAELVASYSGARVSDTLRMMLRFLQVAERQKTSVDQMLDGMKPQGTKPS